MTYILILSGLIVLFLILWGGEQPIYDVRKIERPENKVRFYLQELKAKGIEFVASGDPGELTSELREQAERYVKENREKYEIWYKNLIENDNF